MIVIILCPFVVVTMGQRDVEFLDLSCDCNNRIYDTIKNVEACDQGALLVPEREIGDKHCEIGTRLHLMKYIQSVNIRDKKKSDNDVHFIF